MLRKTGRRARAMTPLLLLLGASAWGSAQAGWDLTATKALTLKPTVANSAVPGSLPLHVIISLKLQNQDQLKAFLKGQHTLGSPYYGKTLTSEQFAAAYSPSAAQAQAVADYLKAAGFRNVKIEPNRVVVSADGNAAVAQKAFNTRMRQFNLNGKTAFAPVTNVMVPDSLGGSVLSVLGLQNVNKMVTATKHFATADEIRHQAVKPSAAGTPAIIDAYTAAQIRTAYDVGNTPTGAGTVIAISTSGSDLQTVISDLRKAETDAGLPQVPVSVVQVAPLPSPQDNSGDGEWDLDSQTSTGIATNVKGLVFYNATDLGDSTLLAYNRFVTDNVAKVGNMSYGGCESVNVALGSVAADDQAFMQAVAQGQTWFASAGDAGAACSVLVNYVTPDLGVPSSVEYPASSPYVVAVGGTTLLADADGNRVTETSWDAGGGGTSVFETAPDWQGAQAPTALATLRAVPDIAMVAGGPDVGTPAGFFGFGGADIVSGGQHGAAVGTSWSSPLAVGTWARLQSARCNSMGFAAPILYGLDPAPAPGSTAAGFNDILIGTNGQWVATPGWDYTTGYGTFDIAAVNAALPAPPAGCVTTVAAPTAQLSSSSTLGPAPMAVTFDGSQSTDPAGLPITGYAIDFGDGTTANQSTPVFPTHAYSLPGTYTARLSVTNSKGGVSQAVGRTVKAFGNAPGCAADGQLMLTSPAGVADAEQGIDLANGTDDLLSTSLGEPASMPNKLVFTTKVANLNQLQPGFRWVTYFDVKGRSNANDTFYFVAMSTANGPTPAFIYGTHGYAPGPEPLSTYTVLGNLDAASTYTADGTITLVLDKAALNIHSGDVITNILTSIRLSVPDAPAATGAAGAVGLTQDSAGAVVPYTVVGNATCGPNAAPVAHLAVTPVGPSAPTAALLDGGSSSDGDAQDMVSYFLFDFGDGSAPLWSSSSAVQHTYASAANYTARLQVADSRGMLSSASDSKVISLLDLVPDAFSFAALKNAALNSDVLSAAVTISGINGPAPVSVSGGSYSVNGGALTSAPGTVQNGDQVRLGVHTPTAKLSSVTATLNVGGVRGSFVATTQSVDVTPDPFSFASVTGVPTKTVQTSNTVTISGLDGAVTVGVVGGQYSVNGGAFTSSTGKVKNGDTLTLSHTSAATGNTTVTTRVVVGGGSATFSSTTDAGADVDPDALVFSTVTGATPNSAVLSNVVTPTGYNSASTIIAGSGVEYSLDGGAFTSARGTIKPGQTVQLRVISAAAGGKFTGHMKIGATIGNFTVLSGS